jgi:hypothetical protein
MFSSVVDRISRLKRSSWLASSSRPPLRPAPCPSRAARWSACCARRPRRWPASRRSVNCTRRGRRVVRAASSMPSCEAYSWNARRACCSPRMRSARVSRSPPRTLPAHPPGASGRALRVRVQEVGGAASWSCSSGPMRASTEHEHRDVEQQRPEHAMRQRIPAAQAEQLLRAQPALPERAVQHPVRRRTRSAAGRAAAGTMPTTARP